MLKSSVLIFVITLILFGLKVNALKCISCYDCPDPYKSDISENTVDKITEKIASIGNKFLKPTNNDIISCKVKMHLII
jgi:hypothetical protein